MMLVILLTDIYHAFQGITGSRKLEFTGVEPQIKRPGSYFLQFILVHVL